MKTQLIDLVLIFSCALPFVALTTFFIYRFLKNYQSKLQETLIRLEERERQQTELRENIFKLSREQQQEQQLFRQQFDQHQVKNLQFLQESIQKAMINLQQQMHQALQTSSDALIKQIDKLTQNTDQRLKEISGQVEKRLSEGFEKTTATFNNIMTRLVAIDEAQKKITELSTNVVSLQEVLADKRSRGAFGEVQLISLIRNIMPENSFLLQHSLSNGKRVDCMLLLPEPTGNIAIDAKFPLESYRKLTDLQLSEPERHQARLQFKNDVKKHINDIASKYIIPQETADGAVMFIPAEAVFAEIHAHYPEIVEQAHQARVWLVSPTTLMAVLTTSRAVLKDAATRKQVHIIRDHLAFLAKDFKRFQSRMDDLAKHIGQAHEDVQQVHISSRKISNRFSAIENVELLEQKTTEMDLLEEIT